MSDRQRVDLWGSGVQAGVERVAPLPRAREREAQASPSAQALHHRAVAQVLDDHAGADRTRGGFGQIMEIGTKGEAEFAVNAIFDRVANPRRGQRGGKDGAAGVVALKSGARLHTKGFQIVPEADRLVLLPGGGMGNLAERDRDAIARDVADRPISSERARADYGLVVDGR